MTREHCWSVAVRKANDHMRERGAAVWDETDYAVAARYFYEFWNSQHDLWVRYEAFKQIEEIMI